MRCSIFGCRVDNRTKSFTSDIKFFSFPKDKKTQNIWKSLCKRSDKFNISNARVCSRHFDENSDYKRNLQQELLGYLPKSYRPLKEDAIPTKNIYHRSISNESNEKQYLEIGTKNQIEKNILELQNCVKIEVKSEDSPSNFNIEETNKSNISFKCKSEPDDCFCSEETHLIDPKLEIEDIFDEHNLVDLSKLTCFLNQSKTLSECSDIKNEDK